MKWYMLYTRHHHERAVYERLLTKGFEPYLPLARDGRRAHRGLRRVVSPLFPRLLFVHCYLEIYTHIELFSVSGVLQIVEDSHGQPLVVADDEIQLLRKLCNVGSALASAAYPPDGEIVEVVEGSLQGVSGFFSEQNKARLLIPLHALRTSVAVEVSRKQVVSLSNGGSTHYQGPCPSS
jgi:transcriptional antiterminator RfaH